MMHRRSFLASLATPLLAQRRRPTNVVFILADDLGYGDVGCYGQKQIQTPNLDRMAADGIRFTQAYAGCTVCAPSRSALMTGYHTGHTRIRGNGPNERVLRTSDAVIPEYFKKAGYATGMFGKWALGGVGYPGYPTRKGWDEWFGFFSQAQAHLYHPGMLLDGDHAVELNGNWGGKNKQYAPDLFLNRALQFLDRNKEKPFFLYFPSTIPHANNELGRDTGDGIEIADDAPYSGEDWPKLERKFAATITRLDRDIGRILEKLKELGLEEDTLVLFSSDNGPHKEGGHDPDFFQSSGPLRGIKRSLTEGGIRVPFIARWPGRIAPGQVSHHPFAFWDLLPTFTELLGQTPPADTNGLSILPALTGGKPRVHEYFYWEFHEGGFAQAVRASNWKYIKQGGKTQLFDLSKDIHEDHDLLGQYPEVVARMEKILATARVDSPDFPVKAPPSRPAGTRNG